jgi:hypothetical protein
MVRQVKDTLADINNKYGVNLKYLQHSSPKTPRIYGLPKIHKSGAASIVDAPTERLSKWLTNKLKDLPDPPRLFVTPKEKPLKKSLRQNSDFFYFIE